MSDPRITLPQAEDSTGHAYRAARRYWGDLRGDAVEAFGVAPIGECGLAEVFYRDHEEFRHLSRIVNFAGKSVLEIGSGNGRWAVSLAALARDYVGVDFSPAMIDVASKAVAERGIANVTFVHSAAQDYVPTRRFDVIYLSGVAQYIHDADLIRLLERLAGALRSGGVMIDRSTTHLRQRVVQDNSDYFSIYRTSDEIVSLFGQMGWSNFYRQPSYRFLSFPKPLRRWLSTRKFARLVEFAAPISFYPLRWAAELSALAFKPEGEALEFSHDFFLFRRSK